MKKIGVIVLIFFCAGAISLPTFLWGEDSFTPWNFNHNTCNSFVCQSESEMVQKVEGKTLKGIGKLMQAISRVDGDRCPMAPTCSSYALQAFHKHGFFIGYIMTCDRLIRCGGNDTAWVPVIETSQGDGYSDTLTDNDFWWTSR